MVCCYTIRNVEIIWIQCRLHVKLCATCTIINTKKHMNVISRPTDVPVSFITAIHHMPEASQTAVCSHVEERALIQEFPTLGPSPSITYSATLVVAGQKLWDMCWGSAGRVNFSAIIQSFPNTTRGYRLGIL